MKLNINNIHNIGKRGFGRILLVGAASMALVLGACTRDDVDDGIVYGKGQKVHAKVSMQMTVPSASQVTRAASLDNDNIPRIEALWVGVFDTKSGEMVGRRAGHLRKADGTRYTTQGTISGLDIYYYDSNPEVYIAAVANYSGVKAKMAGESDDELVTLSSLLGINDDTESAEESSFNKTITWDEFRAISVNTESIARSEQSYRNECPFMMGFFTNEYKGTHTMVNPNGSMPDNARIQLTEGGVAFAPEIDLKGSINLYRLVSEFKVNVRAGQYGDYSPYKINVSNVQYKVVNKPLEVYLAERPTYTKGAIAGKGTYRDNTSNSADVAVIDRTAAGYTSDEEWIDAQGSPEEGYTFSFQQYENKHLGADYVYGADFTPAHLIEGEYVYFSLPYPELAGMFTLSSYVNYFMEGPANYYTSRFASLFGSNPWYYSGLVLQRNAHAIREARYNNDGDLSKSNMLKALVADTDKAFNNNASYIVLKADVTLESMYGESSSQRATVEYTIHEGFTTKADGTPAIADFADAQSVSDIIDRMFDYQCTRNTLYTYNIQINGFDDLALQAEGESSHNDGLTGTIQKTILSEVAPLGWRAYHDGFLSMEQMGLKYKDRSKLKWRYYERKPVKDAQGNPTGATVETNYGTWDPTENPGAQFDWPALTTDMRPASDCDFYNDMTIAVWRRGSSGSSGSGSAGYYGFTELVGPMTIDEFISSEDHQWVDEDYIYYAIRIPTYEVDPEDEGKYENYEYYRRGFYFYLESEDIDGCGLQYVYGLEQNVYDDRPGFNGSASYIFNHNHYDGSNYNRVFPSHGYYYNYWSTGIDVMGDDRIELEQQQIYIGDNGGGDYQYDQITTYALEVKGYEPIYYDVVQNPEYLVKYDWYYKSVVSIPTAEVIEKLNLSAGDYMVALYPVTKQPDYKPFTPDYNWFCPLIVHPSKWVLSEDVELEDGPWYLYNNDYVTYGGITIAGGTGGGNSGVELLGYGNNGHINFAGSGRYNNYCDKVASPSIYSDFRLVKFGVNKHGTIKLEVNATGTNVVFATSKMGPVYGIKSTKQYVSGRQTIEFDTHELIDDFYDYPSELAFYSDNGRLYIYSIEWIISDDQLSSLEGSEFYYSNVSTGNSDPKTFIHNSSIYGSLYSDFYAVKGATTRFAFYDTKPRASRYTLGFYTDVNSTSPVWEATFNAADCVTDEENGYFVLPLEIPLNANLPTGDYVAKMTALGDGIQYRDGTPHVMLGVYNGQANHKLIHVIDIPNDWLMDDDYSRQNPFYYSYEQFQNTPGYYWDNKGLVLNGGNGSMNISTDYIQFGGAGYPYNSNPSVGRYFSFTVEEGGTLFIVGSVATADTGTTRSFHLYKNTAGGPQHIDDVAVTSYNAQRGDYSLVIQPSEVNGATEFFLCPDNGNMRIYSMQWSPGNINGKKLLITDIAYADTWGEKFNKRHSLYYYYYDRVNATHIVSNHFATTFSFSDNNPVAKQYKFELYPYNGSAVTGPAVYSTTLDADEYKSYDSQSSDNSRYDVFAVELKEALDNLSIGKYRVAVTPIGDPEIYVESETQYIKTLEVVDWQSRGYYGGTSADKYNFLYWGYFSHAKPYEGGGTGSWIYKDGLWEANGLSVNGSGSDTSKAVLMQEYSTRLAWYTFPGPGYPYTGDPNNADVGTGRNFTATINIPGEFWVIARANSATQVAGGRHFYLYTGTNPSRGSYVASGEIAPFTKDFDAQRYPNYPEKNDILDITKPVVLKTGSISGWTDIYLCPDYGCHVFSVFFVPEGSPLYDYWTNHEEGDLDMLNELRRLGDEPAFK